MTAMAGKRTLAALGALAVLCLGIWWGGHPSDLPSFLRDAFVSNPHDVVIAEALNDIQHDYYHPIARTGLVDGALVGAVASLNDPFATYDTPGEYHVFNNPRPQQFSGVGITVSARPSGLVVESVLAGGPAMRAGMHAGDVIDAVGGRSVQSIGSARVVTITPCAMNMLATSCPSSTRPPPLSRRSSTMPFTWSRRSACRACATAAWMPGTSKVGTKIRPSFRRL